MPRECITHYACDCLLAELDQLRPENEKLKEEIKRLHDKYDFQRLVKENDRLHARIEKLEKIKRISTTIINSIYEFQDLEHIDGELFESFDKAVAQDDAEAK